MTPARRRHDEDEAPPTVADWASRMSAPQLTCRDYGHAWRPLSAGIDGDVFARSQRCTRCRAERSQRLTLSGRILSSRYDYPDGYLAPAGMGRMSADTRGILRVESMTRLMASYYTGKRGPAAPATPAPAPAVDDDELTHWAVRAGVVDKAP